MSRCAVIFPIRIRLQPCFCWRHALPCELMWNYGLQASWSLRDKLYPAGCRADNKLEPFSWCDPWDRRWSGAKFRSSWRRILTKRSRGSFLVIVSETERQPLYTHRWRFQQMLKLSYLLPWLKRWWKIFITAPSSSRTRRIDLFWRIITKPVQSKFMTLKKPHFLTTIGLTIHACIPCLFVNR